MTKVPVQMKTSLALKNQLRDDRRTAWVRRCLNLFFLGMLFATGVVSHGETAVEAWVRRYSFEGIGAKDSASKVVTDVAGNVIVAGYTDDDFNSSPDMVIIKYSAAGAPV